MDISARKLSLIKKFLTLTDETIISKLESFIIKENQAKTVSPMSKDDFLKMIDKSKLESENGQVISHKELLDQIESW